MYYGLTAFAMVLTAVVGGGLAVGLLVRHDRAHAAYAFGLLMASIALWALTHVGALLSPTAQWALRFGQLSYVSVVTVPVLWLVFALRYADRGGVLSRRRVGLLLVVPALTLAVVGTAEWHTLFYRSITLTERAGQPIVLTTPGPWHAVNVVYSYTLIAVGTGLLIKTALTSNRLYRRQSAGLVALVSVPWLVNIGYHLGIRPIAAVDPTPLVLVAVGIPIAGFAVRQDLTSFLPVAYERVFRTLADPVLVVAADDTVVVANDAARDAFKRGPLEGRDGTTLLPDAVLDGASIPATIDTTECSMSHDGEAREYLIRGHEIDPDGEPRGTIVTLTDITVQAEQREQLQRKADRLASQTERLEHKNEQLERLADIVSHDLQGPLATAQKLTTLLESDIEDPSPTVEQWLDDLDAVHERLDGFAEHLPRLARESVDVERTEACALTTVARDAWNVVETGPLELDIADDRTLDGDRRRLQQLFENLFRNAAEHGVTDTQAAADGAGAESTAPPSAPADSESATVVRVGTTASGIYIEDDGPGIDPKRREAVFEYGTGSADGTGFGLAIVRTIVEAHGWTITATESATGGARFEIATDR
jgi:signal transduction histidine kinase